jgi:hypothetical protein
MDNQTLDNEPDMDSTLERVKLNPESDREDHIFSVPDKKLGEARQGHSCIIIGPPNSGKTTFLLASERVRYLPNYNPNLQSELTEIPDVYSFPLASEEHNELETSRKELIAAAKRAHSIILCVDITRPQGSLLETRLPVLLAEMSDAVTFAKSYPWHARILQRFRRTPEKGKWFTKRVLNADRFLLVLTKVDLACSFSERPSAIASFIEPVTQARELVGVAVLEAIHSVLKPRATLAVGVSSAWGFHPITGQVLANERGNLIKHPAESEEGILKYWTPFGIREAMSFVITGRAGGTVQILSKEDFLTGWHRKPIKLVYKIEP